MLINETQTANLALPIEAFKAHLCLGRGFDEVSLQTEMLVHYVRAAIAAVEGRCAKILLERRFTYRTQFWAQDAFYTLPVAPVWRLCGHWKVCTSLTDLGSGSCYRWICTE